jgi:hypothetical protein
MKMKKGIAVVLWLLSAVGHSALAHGNAVAKHGGVVSMASDMTFELLAAPGGAWIYVEDHGTPLATTGMSGKLTVLYAGEKSEAQLVAAADKLEAKGVKMGAGAKAVAVLTLPSKKVVTLRFTIK